MLQAALHYEPGGAQRQVRPSSHLYALPASPPHIRWDMRRTPSRKMARQMERYRAAPNRPASTMAARTTTAITIRASWARWTAWAETLHLHPVDGLSHRCHISFQDGNVGLKFGHEGVGLLGRQVRVGLKPADGVVKTAPVVGVEGRQGRRLGLEVRGQVNIRPGQGRQVAHELRHGGIDLLVLLQVLLLFFGMADIQKVVFLEPAQLNNIEMDPAGQVL